MMPPGILMLWYLIAILPLVASGLAPNGGSGGGGGRALDRRQAIAGAAAASAGLLIPPVPAWAEAEATTPKISAKVVETVDLEAINAIRARVSTAAPAGGKRDQKKGPPAIVPAADPPPTLRIRGGKDGKTSIKIPRVGYSLYKTPAEEVGRCVTLALRSGVRHIDVASLYGSNAQVAPPLKQYLDGGGAGLATLCREEDPELLDLFDATARSEEDHSLATLTNIQASVTIPPNDIIGRRGRREGLFISHKVSNAEQSYDISTVRRAVKAAIAELGCQYLDLVSIHSPLTNKEQRLATYEALISLREGGFVRSVGVCNYGLGPLKEIEEEGLGLPAINQLEISPFNMHRELVDWCSANGVAVGCAAWSKLSGADGPAKEWDAVCSLAKDKGMTPAQTLVRWSMQKGYICVPRSGSASKIERVAIAANSYGGVNPSGDKFILSGAEMAFLDGLDTGYTAGKLGRRDGWGDSDVIGGADWDPTDFS